MRRSLPSALGCLGPLASIVLGWTGAWPVAVQARGEASQPVAAREPQVRVLLLQGAGAQLRAPASAAGLRVRDGQGRPLLEWPVERGLPLIQVDLQQGWLRLRAQAAMQEEGSPVATVAPEELIARELWLEALPAASEPDPGLWLQQRRYRGRLQLRLEGNQLQVVNHVPLETYLASVVGSEMPASWPLEALRAQAVAARTYALKARKPAAVFDLQATTASQVYKGVEAETPSTRSAVEGTRGLVLTYDDALIDAVFHSSSGGSATESSGQLWPRQLPYLVSVPDFDRDSPVREWRQPLDAPLLGRAFPELGAVTAIEVLSTTATGRVRQARVVGPSGQLLLSGAQLRSRLGLKSTWVRFELVPLLQPEPSPAPSALVPTALVPPPLPALTLPPPASPTLEVLQLVAVGRGFGHGIGMSQWGALGLARQGESFAAILRHYYRGAQLRPYGQVATIAGLGPGWAQEQSKAVAVSP
ncbi:MAG: SpoIID/LytB domain-containing protein [Vulcanococcus sp.]